MLTGVCLIRTKSNLQHLAAVWPVVQGLRPLHTRSTQQAAVLVQTGTRTHRARLGRYVSMRCVQQFCSGWKKTHGEGNAIKGIHAWEEILTCSLK